MSDLDKQLFEVYGKKKGNAEDFIMLVENLLGDLPLIQETEEVTGKGTEETVTYPIPKLRITEAWGKPGSKDREIIERYSRNIPGESLPAKIKFLSDVTTGELQLTDVKSVLSALVMLEVLSTILDDYTESAGGFIFEGFLAGLFGGKAEQITEPEKTDDPAAGKPITDVVLGGVEYSLKLLGQTTGVKGSFKNMVKHFKVKDHVVYLDARRVGGSGETEGLEFGEFRITLENFVDVFVKPFLEKVTVKEPSEKHQFHFKDAAALQDKFRQLIDKDMAIKSIKTPVPRELKRRGLSSGLVSSAPTAHFFKYSPGSEEVLNEADLKLNNVGMSKLVDMIINMKVELLQKYAPFDITYTEEKYEKTKASKIFGSYAMVEQLERAIEEFKKTGDQSEVIKSLEMTPGYLDPQQFEFTRQQAEEIRGFETIAFLPLGEQALKASWERYATLLESTIAPIYHALENFSDNLSLYMTGGDEDRKGYLLKASSDVDTLKDATEKAAMELDDSQLSFDLNEAVDIDK